MSRSSSANERLPVDTNNPSSPKGSGVESLRSSEPVVLASANPQRLGRATRKDALLSAPNTNSRVAHKGSASASAEGASSIPATVAKFDKVSYQRVYMAKWRSEIKSGKRVPKRKGEAT